MIDNEERMEAGYLQSKYEKITIDEVLDFHNRLLTIKGADAFIRQGAYTPRVDSKVTFKKTMDLPSTKKYHCDCCGSNFDIFGKLPNEKDCCPQCGAIHFIRENH